MFNISRDGIIRLSRGDSCKLPLFINQGTAVAPIRYNLKELDKENTVVYLSVMQPNQYFENGCIRKKFSKKSGNWNLNEYGDLIISIDPKDTLYLMPGKYFYEIKVDLNGNNKINTLIQKKEFWIK